MARKLIKAIDFKSTLSQQPVRVLPKNNHKSIFWGGWVVFCKQTFHKYGLKGPSNSLDAMVLNAALEQDDGRNFNYFGQQINLTK